jgi:hypothetical protein
MLLLGMGVSMATMHCAGVSVEPKTVVTSFGQMSQATLIIGEITRPRDLTTAAPFYVAMQRNLGVEIEKAHVAQKIMDERDLGPNGVEGRAFVLRYRVVEDNVVVTSTGSGCAAALLISGSLTLIPIFFLGLCTASADHNMRVEARVFDLQGAQVKKVQDSNSNELLNVYDTSMLTPVLRKEYPIKVSVSVGYNHAAELSYDSPESHDIQRQEAAEATRQLLAQSLEDVSRAIRR